jgi:hypothetical protein
MIVIRENKFMSQYFLYERYQIDGINTTSEIRIVVRFGWEINIYFSSSFVARLLTQSLDIIYIFPHFYDASADY